MPNFVISSDNTGFLGATGLPENEPLPWLYQQQYSEDPDDVDDKSSPRGFRPEFKGVVQTKRKYRRHPKPDEHAPEKPPSAYVMFANHIREELKGQTLSFTEIARLVGERWKALEPEQKDDYENQAMTLKERYNQELAVYKKTEEYKAYLKYLDEFKSKEAAKESGSGEASSFTPASEAPRKRPKLESLPSQGSPHSSLPGSSTTSVVSVGPVAASASSRSQQHAGESPSYQPANVAAGQYTRRESYTSPFPQPSTPASQLSPTAFTESSTSGGQGIRQYQSSSSGAYEAVTLPFRDSPGRPTHHSYYDPGRPPPSGGYPDSMDQGMMMHLPKISTQPLQQVISYSRRQPSPGDSPSQHARRSGSISGTSYQQQRPALHPADTLSTQNSISSSGSSSVPSLTPATSSDGDGRQIHGHSLRALPPLRNPSPSHGQRGPSGYFTQRPRDLSSSGGGGGSGGGGNSSGYPGQGHGSTSSSPRGQLPSLAEQTMQEPHARRGGDGTEQQP
ncbi:hypothetical protein Dda_2046 [Drechslerella dactyloides]|uniref:HMG box domain-containing protein n=1 Tax=Drechslerella dactyloides TaxID=74499 RepID=A0AAD6NMA7_DREDA|nr:hypothetical protein Dda_2046 [Drechslerella dactyloides]